MEILSTSDTLTLVFGEEDHCYLAQMEGTYFLIAALFPCVCSLIRRECLAWATLPATHITPKPG